MDSKLLDFAYKYPFSNEAKALISEIGENRINRKYLEAAKNHINDAITTGLQYTVTGMSSTKTDYLITYIYSRMLLSATRNTVLIRKYCGAEAARSSEALSKAEVTEVDMIVNELELPMTVTPFSKMLSLSVRFDAFLGLSRGVKGMELSNQKLGNGFVSLETRRAISFIEKAIDARILKGLPISLSLLPNAVVECAKGIRPVQTDRKVRRTGKSSWVEKLLSTPIADVRHRTVNLILAPYFVNSRGMSVEQATKAIVDYIEKCKEINPNTRVNERYIAYQCAYAKKRGLKPLSLVRARELLGDIVDFLE